MGSTVIRIQRERLARGGPSDGWHSVQAGFLAVGLVGVTMATFGPFFSLAVAYGLLVGAFVAAICSLWWADRVAHAATEQGSARRDARRGQVLGGIALLLILYHTGVWVLILYFSPAALVLALAGWSIHRARIARSGTSPEVGT